MVMVEWRSSASPQARHLPGPTAFSLGFTASCLRPRLQQQLPLPLNKLTAPANALFSPPFLMRPAVGKSTLLTELTGTNSEAAGYEFTT